jgi:hypothetical protein
MEMSLGNDVMAPRVLIDRMIAAKLRAVRSLAFRMGLADPFAATEAERLAVLRAAAMPPASCGPEMPLAPARGEVVADPQAEMLPTPGQDGYTLQHSGFRGRDAMRARDALDGVAGLSGTLAKAGRAYAALVERHASRGLRCTSIEARLGGGGGSGERDYADVLLAEARAIERIQMAIGDGVALDLQRQGGKRRAIPVRRLVDMVCVEGRSLDAVLKLHGWSLGVATREPLRLALVQALTRMAMA